MAQFYVSLEGGAYVRLESPSIHVLHSAIREAKRDTALMSAYRPDESLVYLDPSAVVLIQPPVPQSIRLSNPEKE